MASTTNGAGAHMTSVSRRKRPATSGNKHVISGKQPQSSATSQGGKVRGVVKSNLKGPFYI